MELREPSWPVLDDVVGALVEDLSADGRRRYGRAAAHLLRVLTSDDLPGELDADGFLAAVPHVLRDLPSSTATARTYVVLIGRLVEHLGGAADDELAEARQEVERARLERPPDPWAATIPARLLTDP